MWCLCWTITFVFNFVLGILQCPNKHFNMPCWVMFDMLMFGLSRPMLCYAVCWSMLSLCPSCVGIVFELFGCVMGCLCGLGQDVQQYSYKPTDKPFVSFCISNDLLWRLSAKIRHAAFFRVKLVPHLGDSIRKKT